MKISNAFDIYIRFFRFKIYIRFKIRFNCQKQPPRGVPGKRYSENMQQIYRRIPMWNAFPKGGYVWTVKFKIHAKISIWLFFHQKSQRNLKWILSCILTIYSRLKIKTYWGFQIYNFEKILTDFWPLGIHISATIHGLQWAHLVLEIS